MGFKLPRELLAASAWADTSEMLTGTFDPFVVVERSAPVSLDN